MIDTTITLEQLNRGSLANMGQNLGIEFTAIDAHCLEASMPVDHRTRQPLGYLNGGASAALCETVGSTAAYLSIDRTQYYCLGIEIKCNHIKSIREGSVIARASPIHIGRTTQVWQIEIRSAADAALLCFSTHTVSVIPYIPGQREQLMAHIEGFI
ncbi:MAG: PaaI family thioesterase [Bacteroidota bacterium]|nr:PaaI family thioesterase [Bacteroidota bacterium]